MAKPDLLRRALSVREKRLGGNDTAAREALLLGLVLRREGKSVRPSTLRRARRHQRGGPRRRRPVALALDRRPGPRRRASCGGGEGNTAGQSTSPGAGGQPVDTARAVGRLGTVLSEGRIRHGRPCSGGAGTQRRKLGRTIRPSPLAGAVGQPAARPGDRAERNASSRGLAGGARWRRPLQVARHPREPGRAALEEGAPREAGLLFARSFEVRDRMWHDNLFALSSRGAGRVASRASPRPRRRSASPRRQTAIGSRQDWHRLRSKCADARPVPRGPALLRQALDLRC